MKLHLERVSAGYGRVNVLRDVTLTVPDGSAVALLGANGAGKSTLLATAAGHLRATTGHMCMDDTVVDRWRPSMRARHGLCLIPEGRGIFRLLTVRENLAMQAGGRNLDEAIARAAKAFPILAERLDQVAGTLSGGQQQMLAVARAFVTESPLVLADELSMGLAPVIIDEILAAVEALRAQGRSLLIVEQYAERILPIVDYVYVLHKGRVVFVGEPAQCQASRLFERYMHGAA
ncbi:MAG TPA: ABC transporter ATP-binding protein [Acidimicrobiia bacterium]|nr:ABC transporter ATP-binding protein [Acidimicrobiia bacterium]